MLAGIACAPAMVGLVLLALLAPAVLGASRPVASGDAIRTSPLYPVALVLFLLARFWPALAGADLSFSTWYRPRGLVHALDTGDAPAEVARIKSRYERRLLEIFRARD